MDDKETPLSSVPAIPHDVVARLAKRWITSAEQLVALGGSDAGVTALSSELGIEEARTKDIVDAARAALDPTTSEALKHPVDTSRYPLGAHKPKSSPPKRKR